jgi:hypothetical protein
MEGRLDLIDGGWRIVVNLRLGRNSVFPAGVNTDHVPDPQRQRLAARKRPVPMPLFSGIESTKVDLPVVVPDRRIELASPKHTAHIAAGNVRSEIATTMLHRRLIGHFP